MSAADHKTVGVVGAGTMGGRMVEALLATGRQVVVHDIDPDATLRAKAAGAVTVETSADVAVATQVVLLSLPMPSDVTNVVRGDDGLLAGAVEGTRIVDLSTVDPATTQANAEAAARESVGYVDAPVLGRPQTCGRWTLPLGGCVDDVEAVRSVLDVLASRVVHVGENGSGHALKLLNNLMFGAINGIASECMAAADRLGLSRATFYDVLSESNAASVSNLFLEIGPKIVAEDWTPAFSVDLLVKDNDLALEAMRDAGMTPRLGEAVARVNHRAQDAGLGALDTSAVFRVAGNGAAPPV